MQLTCWSCLVLIVCGALVACAPIEPRRGPSYSSVLTSTESSSLATDDRYTFTALDRDRDGRLDRFELPIGIGMHLVALDKNQDGVLTRDEFEAYRP